MAKNRDLDELFKSIEDHLPSIMAGSAVVGARGDQKKAIKEAEKIRAQYAFKEQRRRGQSSRWQNFKDDKFGDGRRSLAGNLASTAVDKVASKVPIWGSIRKSKQKAEVQRARYEEETLKKFARQKESLAEKQAKEDAQRAKEMAADARAEALRQKLMEERAAERAAIQKERDNKRQAKLLTGPSTSGGGGGGDNDDVIDVLEEIKTLVGTLNSVQEDINEHLKSTTKKGKSIDDLTEEIANQGEANRKQLTAQFNDTEREEKAAAGKAQTNNSYLQTISEDMKSMMNCMDCQLSAGGRGGKNGSGSGSNSGFGLLDMAGGLLGWEGIKKLFEKKVPPVPTVTTPTPAPASAKNTAAVTSNDAKTAAAREAASKTKQEAAEKLAETARREAAESATEAASIAAREAEEKAAAATARATAAKAERELADATADAARVAAEAAEEGSKGALKTLGKLAKVAGPAMAAVDAILVVAENKEEIAKTGHMDVGPQVDKTLNGAKELLNTEKDVFTKERLGGAVDVLSGFTGTVVAVGTQIGDVINDIPGVEEVAATVLEPVFDTMTAAGKAYDDAVSLTTDAMEATAEGFNKISTWASSLFGLDSGAKTEAKPASGAKPVNVGTVTQNPDTQKDVIARRREQFAARKAEMQENQAAGLHIGNEPVIPGQPFSNRQMSAISMGMSMNPANKGGYSQQIIDQYEKQKQSGSIALDGTRDTGGDVDKGGNYLIKKPGEFYVSSDGKIAQYLSSPSIFSPNKDGEVFNPANSHASNLSSILNQNLDLPGSSSASLGQSSGATPGKDPLAKSAKQISSAAKKMESAAKASEDAAYQQLSTMEKFEKFATAVKDFGADIAKGDFGAAFDKVKKGIEDEFDAALAKLEETMPEEAKNIRDRINGDSEGKLAGIRRYLTGNREKNLSETERAKLVLKNDGKEGQLTNAEERNLWKEKFKTPSAADTQQMITPPTSLEDHINSINPAVGSSAQLSPNPTMPGADNLTTSTEYASSSSSGTLSGIGASPEYKQIVEERIAQKVAGGMTKEDARQEADLEVKDEIIKGKLKLKSMPQPGINGGPMMPGLPGSMMSGLPDTMKPGNTGVNSNLLDPIGLGGFMSGIGGQSTTPKEQKKPNIINIGSTPVGARPSKAADGPTAMMSGGGGGGGGGGGDSGAVPGLTASGGGMMPGGMPGSSGGGGGAGAVPGLTASGGTMSAPGSSGYAGELGSISEKYESGGRGAGVISTGKGDHGGKSYGANQLSTKSGTLNEYLKQSQYKDQFAGLTPGSSEFDNKWKQIAASDPNFKADQSAFIKKSHFDPQMAKLAKDGIDLSGKGKAVQEALYSTSVQYRNKTPGMVKNALAGKDPSKMSDAEIVSSIQDYKAANVNSHFKSSSQNIKDGVSKRIQREKGDLLKIANDPSANKPQQAPGNNIGSTPVNARQSKAASGPPTVMMGGGGGGGGGGLMPGMGGSMPGMSGLPGMSGSMPASGIPGISTGGVAGNNPGVGGTPSIGAPSVGGAGLNNKVSGQTSVGDKAMLDQLSLGEGTSDAAAQKRGLASGYDISLGYGAYGGKTDKPLSQMTLGEVKQYQAKMLADPKNKMNSSAAGKYQIVGKTLTGLQKEMGLSDDTLYDQTTQDAMGKKLLDRRGYSKWKAGKMSDDKFQNNMAMEWASVARSDTKKSHYGQHTGTSDAQIKDAMGRAKQSGSGELVSGAPTAAGIPGAPAQGQMQPVAGSAGAPPAATGPVGGAALAGTAQVGYQPTAEDKKYFTNTEKLRGMDPGTVAKMKAASAETGKVIPLSSGFRTQEHQDRLRAAAVKKYGSEKAASKWVAKTSIHTSGQATDIGGTDKAADAYWAKNKDLAAAMEKQGMYRPLGHESWHWEDKSKTGGKDRQGLAGKLVKERENWQVGGGKPGEQTGQLQPNPDGSQTDALANGATPQGQLQPQPGQKPGGAMAGAPAAPQTQADMLASQTEGMGDSQADQLAAQTAEFGPETAPGSGQLTPASNGTVGQIVAGAGDAAGGGGGGGGGGGSTVGGSPPTGSNGGGVGGGSQSTSPGIGSLGGTQGGGGSASSASPTETANTDNSVKRINDSMMIYGMA